ncbi:MAG: hypothetical protein C0501_26255 [Isosphaera sp.]|nr:hypothetical protein [Isosphaera sp.]
MTRIAVFGVLVLAAVGRAPADDKKDVPKELAPFQGTWKVVKAEVNGKVADKDPADVRFVFEGTRLTVRDGRRDEVAELAPGDGKADPAQLLLTPKGEKKEAIGMIYKFDKDGRLTMCFVKGEKTPPKEFKSTADGKETLFVLEKVKE